MEGEKKYAVKNMEGEKKYAVKTVNLVNKTRASHETKAKWCEVILIYDMRSKKEREKEQKWRDKHHRNFLCIMFPHCIYFQAFYFSDFSPSHSSLHSSVSCGDSSCQFCDSQ